MTYAINYFLTSLTKHIKSVHKKIKFKCEICGKKLSRKDKLQRHKKTVHWRSSEFKCTVCEKKFSTKEILQAHKKVCCKCKHCHEQFSSLSELLNRICPKKNKLNRPQNDLNPMNQLFKRLLCHFLQTKFKALNNHS